MIFADFPFRTQAFAFIQCVGQYAALCLCMHFYQMRDCILAESATLEADVVLKRSVVAKNALLRSGCKVTQSILMDGTEVGPKAVLQGVILCPGAKVGKDCKVRLFGIDHLLTQLAASAASRPFQPDRCVM